MRQFEEILSSIPSGQVPNEEPLNPNDRTAIILVSGYNGFGLHSWLSVFKEFPKLYRNFIFVSVAEIDSGAFKGASEIEALKSSIAEQLAKYVKLARSYGYAADYRMDVGTDVVETATNLCQAIVQEFPKSSVFTGKWFSARSIPSREFSTTRRPTPSRGACSGRASQRLFCRLG